MGFYLFRHMEKNENEDMEDENMIWFDDVNITRADIGLDSMLIDWLEKKSYFQSSLSSKPSLNTSKAIQNENASEFLTKFMFSFYGILYIKNIDRCLKIKL